MPLLSKLINIILKRNRLIEEKPAYDNFEEALKHCKSYDNDLITSIVSKKTKQFINNKRNELSTQDIYNLFAIRTVLNEKDPLHILDVGGGCGKDFIVVNDYLNDQLSSYTILETTGMSVAGTALHSSSKISFIDSTVNIPSVDMLIFSGVIQYTEDLNFVNDILEKSKASFIYITRTGFVSNSKERYVTTLTSRLEDHGPGRLANTPTGEITVPCCFYGLDLLMEITAKHDFNLEFEMEQYAPSQFKYNGRLLHLKNVSYFFKKNVL